MLSKVSRLLPSCCCSLSVSITLLSPGFDVCCLYFSVVIVTVDVVEEPWLQGHFIKGSALDFPLILVGLLDVGLTLFIKILRSKQKTHYCKN